MSPGFDAIETPSLLVDRVRLLENIRGMQEVAGRHGVELWPHIKTHKMREIARLQLSAGATGLTCAKTGEAEAMIPSGVKRIFIAHSLVSPLLAPRLRALAEGLEELVLAVTSVSQAEALEAVLASAELRLPVMVAIDTGLHREGARTLEAAREIVAKVRDSPRFELRGFYTHEGHAYGSDSGAIRATAIAIHEQISAWREALAPGTVIWPGCSVTAAEMATLPGVQAIRPGCYVFGDLSLCQTTRVMSWERVALTVLATVIDKPERGLALIDAGTKVFSSDHTPDGTFARSCDQRDIEVYRCSEEHGFLRGQDVEHLRIGERLRMIPAHVCPCVNLADSVCVIEDDAVVDRWVIDARGKVR